MAAVAEEAPARHRRWPRRLLIALSILVVLALGAAGAGYAYLGWRWNQVDKIDLDGVLGERGARTTDKGEEIIGDPMNVLLVGSDNREQLTGSDCKRNCRDEKGELVTGQRSDTIMVLHIDPKEEKASILSIPRDLWVTPAGSKRQARINSAFENGPAQLIQTIQQNLGLTIHHYVQVDFIGFRNLVNAVGGVPIYVPAPARDVYSDLRLPIPGCITMNGDTALGWVRSRHYQYYEAGRWKTDPSSDFGRIARQQDFIRRLMRRSIEKGIRNPFKLNQMIGIAIKNVKIDNGMKRADIIRLGKRFRSLEPQSVDMITLPTFETKVSGADVLKVKDAEAKQIVARFNGIVATPPPGAAPAPGQPVINVLPNQVRVRILNGSGVNGLAGRAAQALTPFGFGNAGTGDAPTFGAQKSLISFATGQQDKARLLQSYLRASATIQEDKALQGVDLVLTVGRDYTGVAKPAPAATPTATTTTVAAAPATTLVPPSPVPVPKGAPPSSNC